MLQANTRSEHARILAQLLAVGMMLACSTTERAFNENTHPAIGGGSATGGVTGLRTSGVGGQSPATSSNVGGTTVTVTASASGGGNAAGGASTNANGGATSGGASLVGGAATAAGGSASSTGGAFASGGTTAAGGATALGGSRTAADTGLGGTAATGGTGAVTAGGTPPTGGALGTGGSTSTCTPTTEDCTDGIDNDCNGNIDCPIISGRFPEPGRAAAGDDAWAQLNAPKLAIQAVQCRTGKPSQVASKLWTACTSSAPTSLTVYSMGAADAQLADNNGVTQFEFRFLYTNGAVSDPSSIVYYAHNSLWDNVAGTPALACSPLATDAAYFSLASSYVTGATSQPSFAASDVQLKNPFIALKFTPSHLGMSQNNVFTPTSEPQQVNVLSLRHRFVLDPNRQMLLVTRSYQARRGGATCRAAIIEVRDTHTGGVKNAKAFKNNHCDAIVLNKAGSGVCIEVVAGSPTVRGIHSTTIHSLLVSLGIPWPNVDMTLWQKLFDDRPPRKTHVNFSDKCLAEDAACFAMQASVPGRPAPLSLPDSNDAYFTSP